MANQKIPSLENWPDFLSRQKLPILRATKKGILWEKEKYESAFIKTKTRRNRK